MKRPSIAIIGAGVSGLAAAWSLRNANAAVTIFEKSRGVSGRAASRTRHETRLDHGANYFKTDSPSIAKLVHEELASDNLVRIEKPVWTFDKYGDLSPGDPGANASPRWTYRTGISTLGKLLAEESGATITRNALVSRLDRDGASWHPIDSGGTDLGAFDAVLLTPPGPQTAAILEASQLPAGIEGRIAKALNDVRYHRQFSILLGVDSDVERPGDFYALINSDRRHDIAWLSFENDKPGHVPSGQTVLVVQMSPDWSSKHFDDPRDQVIEKATEAASRLLGQDLPLTWTDSQRWKLAHPADSADADLLATGEPHRLFFAGDGLAGKGRISLALESGLAVACRMHECLGLESTSAVHP